MLRRPARTLFALILLLSLDLFAGTAKKAPRQKSLAEQIKTILSQPPLDRAHWGIDVVEVKSGKVLYSLNPDQLFLPASNAKLFTTAAALAFAGADYRFHTTVEANGKTDSNGRLAGDLVIMGPADPTLPAPSFPSQPTTHHSPPTT